MKMSVNAITFDVSILNNIHETYDLFGALSLCFFSLLSLSFSIYSMRVMCWANIAAHPSNVSCVLAHWQSCASKWNKGVDNAKSKKTSFLFIEKREYYGMVQSTWQSLVIQCDVFYVHLYIFFPTLFYRVDELRHSIPFLFQYE